MLIHVLLIAALLPQDPDGLPNQEELIRRRDVKLKAAFLTKADWSTDFDEARSRARKTGKLIFISRCLDQACVDTDVAARQGECIYSGVIDDKKRKFMVTVICLHSNAVTDFVDVFSDLRIFDHHPTASDIAHDRTTNLRFGRLGQKRVRRATHIGEINVISMSSAGKYSEQHQASD